MADVDPCLVVDYDGYEYREFACIYPQLKPFYFE